MAVACVSLLFAATPAMAGASETASAAGSVTVVAGGVGGPGPGTSVAFMPVASQSPATRCMSGTMSMCGG